MSPRAATVLFVCVTACGGGLDAAGGSGASSQACVDHVNALRATKNLPPLRRWSAAEECSGSEAKSDSESGKAHGAFGRCGEHAQCECPGWGSLTGPGLSVVPGCLDAMWAEGPGGGHYDIMTSKDYAEVSCGFYTTPAGAVWAVQDYR
ncbi:MAG TPA: CAP domain-containing protein [Anaeromyxobacteraceae bacterium]